VATGVARAARDEETEFENPNLESEVESELANRATTKQGYWLELRYRFWPEILSHSFLGWEFENPQLVAVLRGEQVWLNGLVEEAAFGGGRLVSFETDDRRVARITGGPSYRPGPPAGFQLAPQAPAPHHRHSLAAVPNLIPR